MRVITYDKLNDMEFLERFYKLIQPGFRVLDLGAGQGKQAKKALELGTQVIAIDRDEPMSRDPAIQWHIEPIEQWINSAEIHSFNAVLVRNVIQFFDKKFVADTLLPKLKTLAKEKGVVAIETFYRNPEPPFEKDFLSYWTKDELENNFADWEIIYSTMYAADGKDLGGQDRRFYRTNLIAKNRR